jgi:hypothetical protein
MIIFLGYIPNMMYLENMIHMVNDYHIIYIDNDETRLSYLLGFDAAKDINSLIIPNFAVSTLTYCYFEHCMRYSACQWTTRVYCRTFDTPLELTDPVDIAKVYKLLDRVLNDVSIYTINPTEMNSEIMGRCVVYKNILSSSIVATKGMVDRLNEPIDPQTRCAALETSIATNAQVMQNSYKGCLRKSEHLKVIAINTSDADATTFINVNVWNDYHLGIAFSYNGNMWYKVWRLGYEPSKHITCRKIAEAYGGHGTENYGEFKTTGQLEVLPIK